MPRLPTVAYVPTVVFRRQPVEGRTAWPTKVVNSTPAPAWLAPLPPPVTLDQNTGRDAQHGPTPIRTQLNFAIGEWTTIMNRHFLTAHVPTSLQPSVSRGRMNPIRERVNIDRPQAQSLGDKVSLQQQNVSLGLGKLAFRTF